MASLGQWTCHDVSVYAVTPTLAIPCSSFAAAITASQSVWEPFLLLRDPDQGLPPQEGFEPGIDLACVPAWRLSLVPARALLRLLMDRPYRYGTQDCLTRKCCHGIAVGLQNLFSIKTIHQNTGISPLPVGHPHNPLEFEQPAEAVIPALGTSLKARSTACCVRVYNP